MYYCILSVPELARAMYYVVPVFFSFFPRLCLLRRLGNVHVGFTGACERKKGAPYMNAEGAGRWLVLHLTLARTSKGRGAPSRLAAVTPASGTKSTRGAMRLL